jgi:restriction endonuclease Mrr
MQPSSGRAWQSCNAFGVRRIAVPDFQTLFRPLLEVLDDGQEHQISDVRDQLAAAFSLSDTDLQEMIPSGRVTTFKNRVGWAITYLYRTREDRLGLDLIYVQAKRWQNVVGRPEIQKLGGINLCWKHVSRGLSAADPRTCR